jgi:hypothetical protein
MKKARIGFSAGAGCRVIQRVFHGTPPVIDEIPTPLHYLLWKVLAIVLPTCRDW